MFGCCDGIPGGGVHHNYSTTGGGVDFDIIHARPCAADHAKVLSLIDQLAGDASLAPNDQSLVQTDHLSKLCRFDRRSLVNRYARSCLQLVDSGFLQSIQNENSHLSSNSKARIVAMRRDSFHKTARLSRGF